MKRGDKVWVCYDGKYGRRQEGLVLSVTQYGALIKFNEWGAENEHSITHFFRKRKQHRGVKQYYGFVPMHKLENGYSLMNGLFGWGGDWYRVVNYRYNDNWFKRYQFKQLKKKLRGKQE